jgi:4-hydroxy-tetrahydrodipicolinate synthase
MSATRLAERSEAQPETIGGVWCPAITPVDDKLAPDVGRFVAHGRWLLEHGCHGLVVFGTTGEANSFSVEERIDLLEAALDAGLPHERILVGTGMCALTDSVQLTSHALSLGVAGVLMLPPFYYKGIPDEALAASFDAVIQRVGSSDFKLFLYNFPKLTGVPITPGLIERLLEQHPRTLAGVKDSSGDWQSTKTLTERFPTLAILPGAETLLLPALRLGGAGCISASCNVNPGGIRALYDAFEAGDDGLEERQERLTEVRKILERRPMIPVLKTVIADAHRDPAWRRVRPPLMALPEAQAQELVADLAAQGFRFDA